MRALYNMDKNSITEWVKSDSPYVHRLLITHTDLDGYGCAVMVMGMVYHNHSDIASPLTIYHIKPGDDGKTVAGYVNNPEHKYTKGEDMLYIMITDLGSINLDFYANMIEAGHTIKMIIVDHHQTTFKDSSNNNVVDDLMLTMFHDNGVSATKILSYLWANIKLSGLNSKFLEFAYMVSQYDTGKWSDGWYTHFFNEARRDAPEVIEQLRFIAYRKSSRADSYVYDMVRFLSGDLPSHMLESFEGGIYEEWLALNDEFSRFAENVKPMNETMNKPVLFAYNHGYYASIKLPSVYGVTINSERDNYDYFTLISRRILEQNDFIDILVLVNNIRHAVELRTAKDNINLADIAKLNGGGGHPKAAGFPIK